MKQEYRPRVFGNLAMPPILCQLRENGDFDNLALGGSTDQPSPPQLVSRAAAAPRLNFT